MVYCGLATFSAECVVAQSTKPNIVLINLDDADCELFELSNSSELFPNMMRVAQEGIHFNNFHATTPLCGPSRACLYRGQYAHNTGIRVNQPGLDLAHNYDGGFIYYREHGYFENDLSVWMQDAGYRTMMVGKFIHGDFQKFVPPGWDDYYAYRGSRYYGAYRFTNAVHEKGRSDHIHVDAYRTNAEAENAVHLMSTHVARKNNQPFFLNINTLGPHVAARNHPEMIERHRTRWWSSMTQPLPPSYDEDDMSDKRGRYRDQPKLNRNGHLFAYTHFRERALATRAVDDLVGDVLKAIKDLGLEKNTYVFVTSDNGFLLGHHRTMGKGTSMDRASRVPLFVKGPSVPSGELADHLIGHIDLAPTFVELAGGKVPEFVDGRSFASLLKPNGLVENPEFREMLLIENWASLGSSDKRMLAASTALRMKDSIYTEWANGDKDFFDLATDPHQLENRFDELSFVDQCALAQSLRLLANPAQPPKARFTEPLQPGAAIPTGGEIWGLAEDPYGVTRVSLSIRNETNGHYWNGERWQLEFAQVEAEIDNEWGQISLWSYQVPRAEALKVRGDVSVEAWAINQSREFASPTRSMFRFDHKGPQCSCNLPRPGQTFKRWVLFSGASKDNTKVSEIRLIVRDLTTNQYWDGKKMVDQLERVSVPVDFESDWRRLAAFAPGAYELKLEAVDVSGHVSEGEEIIPFFVE